VILSWSLDPSEQPAFTPIFLFEVLVYGDWITFYLPFVKHIIKRMPIEVHGEYGDRLQPERAKCPFRSRK
jgi:hypothetical protein